MINGLGQDVGFVADQHEPMESHAVQHASGWMLRQHAICGFQTHPLRKYHIAMTLNERCEEGQHLLIGTRYLEAIDVLLEAEALALAAEDFDASAGCTCRCRNASPSSAACGEGIVRLDILPIDGVDPEPVELLSLYPNGQLLIAGWGTCGPAVRFRAMAAEAKCTLRLFSRRHFPLLAVRSRWRWFPPQTSRYHRRCRVRSTPCSPPFRPTRVYSHRRLAVRRGAGNIKHVRQDQRNLGVAASAIPCCCRSRA